MSQQIVTGIAACCREWVVSLGHPWGKCGLCGERPTYVRTLPESEWITPRPPIDERATLDHNAEGGA